MTKEIGEITPRKFFNPDEVQNAYDEAMKKSGYKKVRSLVGSSRYAIRYLPEHYELRTDEEEV